MSFFGFNTVDDVTGVFSNPKRVLEVANTLLLDLVEVGQDKRDKLSVGKEKS